MDGWAVSGIIAEISFNFFVYIPNSREEKKSLEEDMKYFDSHSDREREYERGWEKDREREREICINTRSSRF